MSFSFFFMGRIIFKQNAILKTKVEYIFSPLKVEKKPPVSSHLEVSILKMLAWNKIAF